MSELKAYIAPTADGTGLADYYLKSEADKVIKDLIEKNKRLANKDIIMASEAIKEVYKELQHQKYKRCLAMAGRCRLRGRLFGACGLYEKELWALKWHKRWLELAEHYKESK